MSQIVTARVDDEIKKEMKKFEDVNWSEVLRTAIEHRIVLERQLHQPIDRARALKAAASMDKLRAKSTGKWSGAGEIRKWRDLRR
ncbi:TPA: hypothetical protein H1012_01300 [archaeon]|nr:hypothetical protein [Candidatus Naiadarchaeales archaeon SRR2090153.bin461]HIK02464.1 hypothetical protein [Candidatus Naiadarchaeales archaeon SRR2090159.bin1288]